jgi:hypothetical protein
MSLEQLFSLLVVMARPEQEELKAIGSKCITRHHSSQLPSVRSDAMEAVKERIQMNLRQRTQWHALRGLGQQPRCFAG